MTALKLRKWDSAEHLKTEEDMRDVNLAESTSCNKGM